VAPAIVGGVTLPALLFAAHMAATATGIPSEDAQFAVGTATTAAAIAARKRYGGQAKQVEDLAIFYQRSKRA
jgi:hypothetical protein